MTDVARFIRQRHQVALGIELVHQDVPQRIGRADLPLVGIILEAVGLTAGVDQPRQTATLIEYR